MKMSDVLQYEKLSTAEISIDYVHEREFGELVPHEQAVYEDSLDKIVQIRNDKPFPISKPPPKHRDWKYAVVFLLHFVFILLLSLVEQGSLQDSVISYGKANSWASMLMIITLLGSFFGGTVAFAMGTSSIREVTLACSISFSFILKICLGNILLIMRSQYSFLGILIIVSAIVDTFWYKTARDSVGFVSALLQMVIDITKHFGYGFIFLCAVIVSVQTCVLLWWGAFFIGLISTVAPGYAETLITVMALSLFWITQFFHSMTAFIVGGAVLWIFVKDPQEKLAPTKKLLLYTQCALTTSLGSICKGALISPIAQCVLTLHHWIVRRPQASVSPCSLRGVASYLLPISILNMAQRHHKLTFCLMAVYGRALCPTSETQLTSYPETLDICIEDCTYFILNSISVVLAGVISIIFGLIAERGEGSSWPLFFFVCFYLAYCGISLSMHIYSTAVDALIVAAAINPEKFAQENQIIFLRFLRTAETALR